MIGNLNGLLFWHGVMGSWLLIVNYCCSQWHLITITYQCEKMERPHSFCWSLQGELEVPFVFLYVQVSLYCAMSFLFKPPFVAAFRNFCFFTMNFLFKLSSIATSRPFNFLRWASSSSHVLLQHLGLSVLCVLLFALLSFFFEITIAFSSSLSLYVYVVISNFMKPLKIVLFAQIFNL